MITVVGHKIPDTDAITSAVVYADFLQQQGEESQAIRLGEPNNETRFVFDYLGLELPALVTELAEGAKIALVDHNEYGQSIDARERYLIHSVIDHHKVANFETGYPLTMRLAPLASTNSILYLMYQEAGLSISTSIASLMIAGIISDTLYFRSPTSTPLDREIMEKLNQIAGIPDLEAFAMQMFTAKSDLGEISSYDLIKNVDAKDFHFGEQKALIACIETTNPNYCLNRAEEIRSTIRQIKANEGYDFILFCIVDILQETNTTVIADQIEAEIVKKVFSSETENGLADLGNRISRKKTIVPPLEKGLLGA